LHLLHLRPRAVILTNPRNVRAPRALVLTAAHADTS
jgi:hypothetical protein